MQIVSENKCFGGKQGVYTHSSNATGTPMTFGLFLPDLAADQPVPLVWYLSGLTCTHENAMMKSGAQAWAAELGLAVVFPDTSPRGEGVADDEGYDMGQGAGFYVDATEGPWAPHFKMESYIAQELPDLLAGNFAILPERQSIMGHSMGGHGALTLAMKKPGQYCSVSALSPICNPMNSDWGIKQLGAYLGADADWSAHDASHLMAANGFDGPVLCDTGTSDQFVDLLMPEALAGAMARRRQNGAFRMQPGYDHSYFFVATFIEEHLRFHAEALYD